MSAPDPPPSTPPPSTPSTATSDRGWLSTETLNPRSLELDRLDTREAVALFAREDRQAAEAVERAGPELARAVDLAARALASGGRLLYVGAGTSGRLALLDAVECPPTFRSDPSQVQAVLAGGPAALQRSVEGAEDSAQAGAADLRALAPGARDLVIGITAGGTTPYVHAALAAAREGGAGAILLACVARRELPDPAYVDFSIRLETGPELVCGSTRLKAGTATKLALNTISTLAMVRLGKVHGNLMIDVNTSGNTKLVDRGERLVMRVVGVERAHAKALLREAAGEVKLASLMGLRGLTAEAARERLRAHDDVLRAALEARDHDSPAR